MKFLKERFAYVIKHLPGACFVHADICAPNDSSVFTQLNGSVRKAEDAIALLQESYKVKHALAEGTTDRIVFHPYRRMDRYREFRLFIHGGELQAVSQRYLTRYLARMQGREEELWYLAAYLTDDIRDFLPETNVVIDVYLTTSKKLMIIDLNKWGGDTDPLLYGSWEVQEEKQGKVLLTQKPTSISGDVSVSF